MKEPSLDNALAWARAGYLSQPRDPADDPERDRLAERVAACRRDYPEVFELILDLTLRRPAVDYRLPRFEAQQYAVLREGQNQIAASLLDYLHHAERLQDDRRQSRDRPVRRAQPDGLAVALPLGEFDPAGGDDGDGWIDGGHADPHTAV